MIKVEGVSKRYGEGESAFSVLNNLSLDINDGEIVVLYGKSGSGKSTILNILSGIDLPDSGSVVFDGIDITKLSEKERTLFRRKNIGFVFQFFNLIPTLTVEENLQLPLQLNNIPLSGDEISVMLEEVSLTHKLKSEPDKLSGGEQQRIAISRALIHKPKIILADEPTGNLDYETGKKVIELIDKSVRQKNKTMIMATHSKEVMGLADKLFMLKDGKLIEMDKEELYAGFTN